jgi:hypothetical protein
MSLLGMGKADRQIRVFVEALELVAVYVVADSSGRCRIGVSSDPKRRASKIEGARLAFTYWCAEHRHAALVVAHCHAEMKRRHILTAASDWCDIHAADAAQLLVIIAGRESVELSTDDSIRQRASSILTRIDASIEAMKQAGKLKQINAGYRHYRLDRERDGKAAINYNLWFAIWKRNLVRSIAKTANQGFRKTT